MDSLQFLSEVFERISDKLDSTAQTIDGIPIIGRYLASPFFFIADSLQYSSDLILNVNDWWEWIKAGFEALPTFEALIKALEERFGILSKTAKDIYEDVSPYIPQIPEWIPLNFENLMEDIIEFLPDIPSKEDIINWVSGVFEAILDKVFEEGK